MMAFDQQYIYRPASQSSVLGLCSSHSCLDGVPFKISPAVKPAAQPAVSPQLLRPTQPCEAFQLEYAFDTEEAVLAWSRAREEAKVKAMAEREVAQRRQAALAAADDRSSDSEEDAGDGNEASRSAGHRSQPKVPPVGASLSGGLILTPTPSGRFQPKVQPPLTPPLPVDLALFERPDDPFHTTELQTLDDMEELRALLADSAQGGSPGPSPNPDGATVVSLEQECEAKVNGRAPTPLSSSVSTRVAGVRLEERKPQDCAGCPRVGSTARHGPRPPSGSAVGEGATDEDCVHVRADCSQQTVRFQTECGHMNGSPGPQAEQRVGTDQPHTRANCAAFKSVLPPIHPRGKSFDGEGTADSLAGGGMSVSVSSETPSPVPPSRHSVAGMSRSAYAVSASSSGPADLPASFWDSGWRAGPPAHPGFSESQPTPARVGATPAASHSLYSRHGNAGWGSPTPLNDVGRGRLRSVRSNPDLARSTSPYAGTSAQPWNPYPPLPPTPVQNLRSASSSPEPSAAECGPSPSPSPPPPPSSQGAECSPLLSDYDPYPGLPSQAKTFVTNLTCMGFSRARVSRAVEKFGTDDREVLDHLLNVDTLVEQKVAPALAETSLQLFRNDLCKAQVFLGLHQQFLELGFAADRIQTALVKHQLDRDKALDDLTT